MDSSQFGKFSSATAFTLTAYFNHTGPLMVVRETLRFIDDNFRKQGWQGASFQPWAPIKRPGSILVKTGALRRGTNYEMRGNGDVYFYNNLAYAKAHNEGFNGEVNVRAHTRAKYFSAKASSLTELNGNGKHKIKTILNKTGESQINGFTRKMNLIQRQFAPTETSQSPVLIADITHCLETDINNILRF